MPDQRYRLNPHVTSFSVDHFGLLTLADHAELPARAALFDLEQLGIASNDTAFVRDGVERASRKRFECQSPCPLCAKSKLTVFMRLGEGRK